MANVSGIEPFLAINHDWNDVQSYIAIITLSLIDIFAMSLNLLVLFIISKSNELREQTDCLLIGNLAFVDFLVASSIIPFSIDTLIHQEIRFSKSVSLFIGFANFAFCIASILTLMVLVVDQTLIIKIPFKYEGYRTRKLAMFFILYTWIHSISCALPPIFGLSSYNCFIANIGPCTDYQWAGTKSAVWFTILVTLSSWGVALGVTLICYIMIAKVAIRQSKKAKQHNPSSSNRQKGTKRSSNDGLKLEALTLGAKVSDTTVKDDIYISHYTEESEKNKAFTISKVNSPFKINRRNSTAKDRRRKRFEYYSAILKPAVTLLVIIVVYFLTWSPFCILLLIEVAGKRKEYPRLALIFLWIGHSSSFLNPFIYFLRYNRFRRALWTYFRKLYYRFGVDKVYPSKQKHPDIIITRDI